MLFHCEETLTKNLGWNERPLYPLHCREVGIGSPRHDFDAWFWDEKERKQKSVSFDGAQVIRAWEYVDINK